MKAIVVVDEQWGIGKNNNLLFSLPADMKQFREKTTGNIVVMGKKTLRSFPGGRPLKGRINIVLTREDDPSQEGVIFCRSIEELLEKVESYQEEVFVIGGASVYEQLLDYCSAVYVTKVEEIAEADTFFPNLDQHSNWQLLSASAPLEDNGHRITYTEYRNREIKSL